MKIINWLLKGDVSIQYQVHRDLLESNKLTLHNLQKRIELEGFGKRFLECKFNDGYLGNRIYSPKWTSLHYTLYDLYWLGISPDNKEYKKNANYLLDTLWFNKGWVRKDRMQDLCMTSMFIQMACYGHVENPKIYEIVDYLLEQQYEDGGWNCSWQLGHKHSSLHTTLTTLEAFKEYLDNGYTYRKDEIQDAIPKGEEFILRKEFFKSERTKKVINQQFTRFPFPFRWHYDIVRALNYFRKTNKQYDIRMEAALQKLLKISKNGYFRKYSRFQGLLHFSMEDDNIGSRWNTLRALRVLKKYKPNEYNNMIEHS